MIPVSGWLFESVRSSDQGEHRSLRYCKLILTGWFTAPAGAALEARKGRDCRQLPRAWCHGCAPSPLGDVRQILPLGTEWNGSVTVGQPSLSVG